MKVLLRAVVAGVVCVLAVSACHTGKGAAPSESTPVSTPLAVSELCGVTSTDRLRQIFGYDLYWYSYSTGVAYTRDRGVYGHRFSCLLSSNREPYGDIDLIYDPDARVSYPTLGGQVYFDEIPTRFPEASVLVLDDHEGSGWSWFANNGCYMAWRYQDGTVLYARVTIHRGYPGQKQKQDLQVLVAEVVDAVPRVAAQEPAVNVRTGKQL